ncbi:hypothetical protein [Aminicella lysinilytica]|uniref:Nucleic acid binding protein n=1 Tax=Aminicella lysinilytica TaxID=433323 RepID=A0A4V3CRL9_9FIRM|nr:hypothetical protein [Aminicella lysinilytica]TDP57292.1 hypothetical protein EV211_11316 [Aminicella lysinilytica]
MKRVLIVILLVIALAVAGVVCYKVLNDSQEQGKDNTGTTQTEEKQDVNEDTDKDKDEDADDKYADFDDLKAGQKNVTVKGKIESIAETPCLLVDNDEDDILILENVTEVSTGSTVIVTGDITSGDGDKLGISVDSMKKQ